MNNVFVQCELWCEEILRRVARPCCTCSRHVSSLALEDLIPLGPRVDFEPGVTSTFVPGLEIATGPCPSSSFSRSTQPSVCPGMIPEAGLCSNLKPSTHTYFMHPAEHSIFSWPGHKRASRLTHPAQTTTATLSATLPAPIFTDLTSTELYLSSSDWVENHFKSAKNKSQEDQAPITTSSSTDRIPSLSSGNSRETFVFQTLPPKSQDQDQDVDTDWNVLKVPHGSSLHESINRRSVLLEPSSSISDTCE